MVAETPLPNLVGATLDHFTIVAEFGRGAMGIVYLAEDKKLGRNVALKVLRDEVAQDEDRRARFLREARTAAAITHPNLAAIYEVGEADGRVYLAMELVVGSSLRAMLDGRPLENEPLMRIAQGIAAALAKAHDKGIVHRDLKPENVLVTTEGEAKVVDFGLAKIVPDASSPEGETATELQVSSAGSIVGTPAYMSPEQARGLPVDHRADIFSFGVMLYEMATGERPFRGATHADLMSALLRDEPTSPRALRPEVTEALETVILRCLAKSPSDRYASAHDLARDLLADSPARAPALPVRRASATSPDRKSELILLERVREFWIDGVLRQSLRDAKALDIAKDERMGALDRSVDLWAPRLDEDASPIDPGIPIGAYFDRRGRALLILGEPGAGKTVTLLTLAAELVSRALDDANAPLAAVLNLATWRDAKQPIEAWLVEQLREAYRIPERVGRAWIEADRVTLLLDGLDEVAPTRVAACVRALNAFRDTHGFVPIAVACRRSDYEALPQRLKLDAAIVLRALTAEQVDAYVAAGGERLASLRRVLTSDAELRELATSPLMLNIMSLSYAEGEDSSDKRSPPVDDAPEGDRRAALFDRYVERMFKRREGRMPFDRERMAKSIVWLASDMQARSETVFQLEQLQPACLPRGSARTAYFCITRFAVAALFAALVDTGPIAPTAIYVGFLVAYGVPLVGFDLRLLRKAPRAKISRLAWVGAFFARLAVMGAFVGAVLCVQTYLGIRQFDAVTLVVCFLAGVGASLPPLLMLASRIGRLATGSDVRTVESLRLRWRAFAFWGALAALPGLVLAWPYRADPPFSVSLWNAESAALERTIPHDAAALAFAEDARRLVVTDPWNDEAKIYDVTTGAERATPLRGKVVVDPRGRYLATSTREHGTGSITLFDATTLAKVRTIDEPLGDRVQLESISFTPSGLLLACSGSSSVLFDPDTSAAGAHFEGFAFAAADGAHVLVLDATGLLLAGLDGTLHGRFDIPLVTIDGRLKNVTTDVAGRWLLQRQGDCIVRFDLAEPHARSILPTPACLDESSIGPPDEEAQLTVGFGTASFSGGVRGGFGVAPHTGAIVVEQDGHLLFLDADGALRANVTADAGQLLVGDERTVTITEGELRSYRTRDGSLLGASKTPTSRAPWNVPTVRLSSDEKTIAVTPIGASPFLVASLLAAFGMLVAIGVSLETGVVRLKTRVNEGIHRTAQRAAIVGVGIFALVVAAMHTGALLFGVARGSGGVLSTLGLPALIGLMFAVGFGGLDLLQHYTLRALLAYRGDLPLRAAAFLDGAVQLIFLRKVGGGYIFIHRLVLEHFAARRGQSDTAGH